MNHPPFCCPRCKEPVYLENDSYHCALCNARYPVVMGIADFRVFPDRYISVEDDYQKARFLVKSAERDKLNFENMVRLYWSITPDVAPERAERFARRVFALVDKGRENLREIETLSGQMPRGALLEIGCGTGGFLAAASEQFDSVLGCDIAFRWLVVARHRHRELGLEIPLVCCCAEALPFADDGFALVAAENVVEHVWDQDATLRECRRVLNAQGALFVTTPNRFTLAPEPHVGAWGIGLLPRRYMSTYVRLVKGVPYRFLKVLSLPELRRLLRRHGFRRARVTLPGLPQSEVEQMGAREKLAVGIYDAARRIPVLRALLYAVGPSFHVLCKVSKRSAGTDAAPCMSTHARGKKAKGTMR